ncbi:hypothetical protein ACIQNU_21315 [Streptomyces sp. NPDC091292]|uniref:hypothetical protein n=1 Tax=Streptomyces sp. NPDC091292 TaxID=3365991 RepID=UPI00380ED7E3
MREKSESPPLHQFEPLFGEIVSDASNGRTGRVMDRVGGCYQLRPLNGGVEWDAQPANLRPVALSDALREGVAEVNARSKKGI